MTPEEYAEYKAHSQKKNFWINRFANISKCDMKLVNMVVQWFDKIDRKPSKTANISDKITLHYNGTEYTATKHQITRKKCFFKWLCGSIVGDGVDISKDEYEAIVGGLFRRAVVV